MGLYHYLLLLRFEKIISKEKIEEIFVSNNFQIEEKERGFVPLTYRTNFGEIEVLIDTTDEISIRTSIKNDIKLMDIMISVIEKLVEATQSGITIYDYQHKKRLNLSELQELKGLYKIRQDELRQYF